MEWIYIEWIKLESEDEREGEREKELTKEGWEEEREGRSWE